MHKTAYAIVLLVLFLDAVLQYLIASRTQSAQMLRPVLYAQAILPTFLFVSITFAKFNSISKITRAWIRGDFAVYFFVLFTYFLASTFLGALASIGVINPLMDLLRAMSPFLVFFTLLFSINSKSSRSAVGDFISLIFIHVYFLAFAKILLLANGMYYGGGANQFAIPVVVISILLVLLAAPRGGVGVAIPHVPNSTLARVLLLGLILVLTGLSLKREQWFITLIAVFLTLLMTAKKKGTLPLVIFLCVFSGITLFVFAQQGVVEVLINRFQYTFSGSQASQLDRSSFERVAEIQGVLYSLGNEIGFIEYVLGHGNGAEYRLHPDYPSVKLSTGSEIGLFRHVHSMYFILLLRNGLLGLVLYLLPIVLFLWYSMVRGAFSKSPIAGLNVAMVVGAVCILISGFPANSAYGSMMYGFFLCIIFLMVKERQNDKVSR